MSGKDSSGRSSLMVLYSNLPQGAVNALGPRWGERDFVEMVPRPIEGRNATLNKVAATPKQKKRPCQRFRRGAGFELFGDRWETVLLLRIAGLELTRCRGTFKG